MRAMKDSGVEWIGEIPQDWEVAQVRYLFNIGRGRVIAQTELVDDGIYPVYSSQTKNEGCLGYINSYDFEDEQLTWTTDGANAGTVFLRKGKHNCTNVCGTLKPLSDSICLLYQKYALEHIAFYHKRADTNGYKIMNNEMATIKTLIPNIAEQQRIADYLDSKCSKIDTIIEKQQAIIEKLKEYKLSVITEAVTKGLNSDVEMKDSGIEWIGAVPKHWGVVKLKYATNIMRGKFNHRPRNDPRYYDGKYPFVQTGDVARANKFINSYSQSLNELGYSVSKEFPKGSICMTIAANIGDVAVLNFDACFPDSVVGFVATDKVYWEFLYNVLKSMKSQFMRNAIISTQMNLNIEIVKEEFIPIAPFEEQKEVVLFLNKKCDAIDTAINKKQNLIEKLISYKKSLIYEVVTGKKKV